MLYIFSFILFSSSNQNVSSLRVISLFFQVLIPTSLEGAWYIETAQLIFIREGRMKKKNTSLFSKKEGTKILYLTDSILEYRYMSCIPFWILLPTVWPILQSLISHLSQYDRIFLFHSSFVNHPSTLPIHIYRPMCFTSLQKTEPK